MQNKKSKLGSKNTVLYYTDNRMYCKFLLIILIIIILTIVLSRCFPNIVLALLTSDRIGLVSGVISGVLSGLLSSIIVSWLVDLSTCKRKNTILQKR